MYDPNTTYNFLCLTTSCRIVLFNYYSEKQSTTISKFIFKTKVRILLICTPRIQELPQPCRWATTAAGTDYSFQALLLFSCHRRSALAGREKAVQPRPSNISGVLTALATKTPADTGCKLQTTQISPRLST